MIDQLLAFRTTGAGNLSANETWPSATTFLFLAVGGTPKRGLACVIHLPIGTSASGDSIRGALTDSYDGTAAHADASPFAESDLYTVPTTPVVKDIVFRFNTENEYVQLALTGTFNGHNFGTASAYVTAGDMRNNLLVGATTANV